MNIIFVRVLKGAIWKFLFYASSFVLNIVLANFLGANDSGALFYLLNNLGIAALLLSFGLENTVSYFFSKKILSKDILYLFSIVWSAFATFLFFIILKVIPGFFDNSLIQVSPIFLLLYVFGAICTALINALDYAQHKAVLANLVPAVLNIICVFYLYGLNQAKGSVNFSIAIVPVLLVPILSAFFLLLKRVKLGALNLGLLKAVPEKFWGYSIKVYLAALCIGLFSRIDLWLVESFCTKFALGNYIQTIKFAQLTQFIPLLASFSLFPSFAQHSRNGSLIHTTVLQFANLYFYLVMIFCLVVNIFSIALFPLLYGPSFTLMPQLFLLATPGIVAFATTFPFVSYFGASNQSMTTFRTAGEGLVLIVLFNLLLTPLIGIYGAAISFSLANIYFLGRLFYFFKRVHSFSFIQAFSVPAFVQTLTLLKGSLK